MPTPTLYGEDQVKWVPDVEGPAAQEQLNGCTGSSVGQILSGGAPGLSSKLLYLQGARRKAWD